MLQLPEMHPVAVMIPPYLYTMVGDELVEAGWVVQEGPPFMPKNRIVVQCKEGLVLVRVYDEDGEVYVVDFTLPGPSIAIW